MGAHRESPLDANVVSDTHAAGSCNAIEVNRRTKIVPQSVPSECEIGVKSRGHVTHSFQGKRAARKLIFLPLIVDI